MVETRQAEDINDSYMYPDDNLDPYLQDAEILDRPDLFYGPGRCWNIAFVLMIQISYTLSQRSPLICGVNFF